MTEPRPADCIHLMPSLVQGGLERAALDLADCGRRSGFADELLCFEPQPPPGRAVLEAGEVPVTTIPRRHGRDLGHLRALARHLAKRRPRQVLAHNETAAVLAALAALQMWPRPELRILHHNLPFHRTRSARRLYRWVEKSATRRFAVSRRLADDFAEHGWSSTLEVVTPGVDTHRFAPAPPATAARDRGARVGMIGRFVRGKRQDLLLHAVRELRLDPRFRSASLELVGDGPLRDRFETESANECPWITIRPSVPDVAEWLRGLDVFVLLSDHEGAPRSILEAMATDLPTVASAVGGVPELIAGGTGTLVENEVDRVVAALREALAVALRGPGGAAADVADRARHLDSPRRRVVQHFRLEDSISRLLER